VNAVQQTFADEGITQEEWAWVNDLIEEVRRETERDAFARQLFQWDLAVRQFRKLELKRMFQRPPTPTDLHYHGMCLHALLAIGHALVIESRKFQPTELKHFNLQHEQLEAYVEELEMSLREWHHGFTEERLAEVRNKVLGCAA
jgi:glutamate synthase domain-containing protein 3